MQDKLATIIIPTYNAGTTIERCLNSVQSQTYKNLEIIVIDDGSRDNTINIINQFYKSDKRIKVFSKKHNGASSSRNYGLKQANGYYVYFMDADDSLSPKAIEALVNTANISNADVVICNMNFIYGNRIHQPLRLKDTPLNKQQFVIAIAQDAQGYTPNKLYRRDCIKNVKFNTQITMCEDFLFNIEVSKNINKAYIINEYLYNYYQSSDSSSNRVYNRESATELMADEKIFNIIMKDYPQLISLYAYVLLLSTFRQRFFYNHSSFKDDTITNKISDNIKLYKSFISQNHKINLMNKTKIFIYDNFYYITNLLKRLKRHLGGKYA